MPYDTRLSPVEETQFQKQFPDPRSTADYDMRGAWKAGATQGANGHLPDTWKKPNHITFSNESIYHGVDGNQGGQWQQAGGKWSFTPSPTNLKNTPQATLQQYFQKYEPDAQLLAPSPFPLPKPPTAPQQSVVQALMQKLGIGQAPAEFDYGKMGTRNEGIYPESRR